jgi:hypothetical protein
MRNAYKILAGDSGKSSYGDHRVFGTEISEVTRE